jgi:hypothetical protein
LPGAIARFSVGNLLVADFLFGRAQPWSVQHGLDVMSFVPLVALALVAAFALFSSITFPS